MKLFVPLALVALITVGIVPLIAEEPAEAKTIHTTVDYTHGELELSGYLSRPAKGQALPGVLIVHAWRGRSTHVQEVARDLSERGYVAFALDMYGKGVLAKNNQEASGLAKPFYADPALMRARARAGLEVLRSQKSVDPTRIAAIGFCFGGTTVLELARDRAPVRGVLSFHGGLKTGAPAEKGEPLPKIFVSHGGDDPYVPPKDVVAFWQEMKDVGAEYELQVISGAVHAFTDKGAGDDPSKGAAYDARASRRAWAAAHVFMREVTKKAW